MDQKNFLSLYLDGPLQSWGYQSKFDRRTSLSYPTRSGILGIISAAMGIDRKDTKGLRQFDEIKFTIYKFCDSGRMIDFHTVGGGWNKKTHPQHIVPKADGKTGNTVVTYREYLQNAKFGAVVEGESSLLEKIGSSLINPVWGIWFGRKSCIPASPVFQGYSETHTDALTKLIESAGHPPVMMIEEVEDFAEGTDTLMDNPVDFNKNRYIPRRIYAGPYEGE